MSRIGYGRAALVAAAAMAAAGPAPASETVSYGYDTFGRLVKVLHAGTVNDGLYASYAFDGVDNRLSAARGVGTPPALPSFAAAAASATEGGTLVFTITRSGATGGASTIDYAVTAGTATAGTDFTAASGTLAFAAAQTSATVSVATSGDATVEPDETVVLSLSNASGGAPVTEAQAIGTIVTDDFANRPPVAVADQGVATTRCSDASFYDVLYNDSDPDEDALTLSAVSALLGTATISGGGVSYLPSQAGSETVTYTVDDGRGGEATGHLTFTVGETGCPIQN